MRYNEKEYMEHYFKQNEPVIFNRNNEETIKNAFTNFIDQVKGETEAWSQRGSGWLLENIMVAFVNVARNEPFPPAVSRRNLLSSSRKVKNKKAIITIQNKGHFVLLYFQRH